MIGIAVGNANWVLERKPNRVKLKKKQILTSITVYAKIINNEWSLLYTLYLRLKIFPEDWRLRAGHTHEH